MHQQALPKFRVAICGGGIGGLTLAFCLSQCPDLQVDLYEATARFSEVGAGIGMWWRTWSIMKTLRLDGDIAALLVPTLHYRKADQPEGFDIGDVAARGGLLTLHRAEFHQLLLNRLSPRCQTFTGKRLRHYIQPIPSGAPIQLVFQDGSTASCDLLVGADGLRSVVRTLMLRGQAKLADARSARAEAVRLRDCIQPRWTGVLVYRVLIPAERLRLIAPDHRIFSVPTQYLGKNRHLMAYPISHGRFVNVAAFDVQYNKEGSLFTDPWVAEVDPLNVKQLYSDFEPEAKQIVDCIDGLQVNQWAVNVIKPLPTFVSDRVALLGDAAHAMTPFQGAGAGQAIETLHHSLRIYSEVRRPLAYQVAERSRRNGTYFALHDVGVDGAGSSLTELGRKIQQSFDWLWDSDPAVDHRRAIDLLERELSGRL
ncbi:hypothetical protein EWM64_g4332 [Hericium alpestre]|uniref:FAD-binding domain-containing protein n=1 Tax=Hericium alpestre TaxID=135208 RepID=A0A4Z0A052_9AGAM|nr:hypothetical protein EWM64_g4332 [Hericium alpestre]